MTPADPASPPPHARDAMPGAHAVFAPWQRGLLLAAFALLVVFRLPEAWKHGRFLDEEATVFLAYAWHRPWLDALFRPFAGYWNLAANATTLIVARLVQGGIVPLAYAPYLTMTAALLVQLLPAALILTGRASWLASRPAVIAALLMLVMMPATEEVFVNVLHIQFHLALCAALILALDVPERGPARIAYMALLFVAPLCGLSAIIVLPLFALRALLDRDAARARQFAALAGGAAVQMLLFYGSSPVRGHLLDPGSIAAMMFVRLIALPVLSMAKTNRMGLAIHDAQLAGNHGWWWAAAAAVLLFGALVVLALRRRDAAIWLVLAALAIGAVSYGFGMIVIHRLDLFSVGAGERYNFLPIVLLGLSLVVLAMRLGSRLRPVFAALALLFLFTGVLRYPKPLPELSRGPWWADEVAMWRRDHRHPLAVWPAPYVADLSDGNRPCPPWRPAMTIADAPRYCESGWVAGTLHPPQPPQPQQPQPQQQPL